MIGKKKICLISSELKKLCDDVRYQLEYGSLEINNISIRFHHRLVVIHAFPNGNGRHARLATDQLRKQQGYPPYSWGKYQNLFKSSETRKQYIHALQEADRGNFEKLLIFANS
jgi:fido (protein-threonine AMPylation protein)